MQVSPGKLPEGTAEPPRFSEAFCGGDALVGPAREFLVAKLEVDCDPASSDPLSHAELGDLRDPKRPHELRSWFESALSLGWDRASLRPRSLGDLTPPARLLADGRVGPRSLDQRTRLLLERAGYARWSELLDATVAQVLGEANLGPTTVVAVLGACFERSLIGLTAAAEVYDGSALAVLLAEERRGTDQPVLEALMESATSSASCVATGALGAGSRRASSARSILLAAAPWALEPGPALLELLLGITDDQDRSILVRTELSPGRCASLAELAAELGVSTTRVAQRRDRATAQLRDELAAAPAPLGWLVQRTQRTLGRVTTRRAAAVELSLHGLGPESSCRGAAEASPLLLWLAGPFEPIARCPGWIGVQPDEIVTATKEMLAEDGGVRSLLAMRAALNDLGLSDLAVVPWLEAHGGVVVDGDLTVWLSGPLIDVLERLIDAHGRGLTLEECRELLLLGGRAVAGPELERVLGGRRFRRATGEAYELASWPASRTGGVAKEAPGMMTTAPERPVSAIWGAETAAVDAEGVTPGRTWLAVTVDADLLRGNEAPVSEGLVRSLGLGLEQRRTFSSRFGPVMLANDGPEPSRGPLRPVAMGTGAHLGDVLVLGFAPEGDVVVEVRTAPAPDEPSLPAGGFSACGSLPEVAGCDTRLDWTPHSTGGEPL